MQVLTAMVKLAGYEITQQIYNGTKTLVYQGIRESDQKPVVIKFLRYEYPSFNELVQFRNQYTIAKNLEIDGIIKTYSLENYYNSYALVMEFGGISLKEWQVEKNAVTLGEFFHIAIQIVNTLNGLYHNRVIHKDIKGANILINPTTLEVKLIDFSIASLLSREMQTLKCANVLEGTLAYLSPEQTGRMNRGIDYRSDFYSLGVTFFELLTGQLPFISDDAMELVYCHLAKQPPQVHSINSEIPVIISKIINKLMAKNAEDRYQSAIGIKYDLEICWQQWKETGTINVFDLGQRDICDRFQIPEKLYGRSGEVETLLTAFDRVSNPPVSPLNKGGQGGHRGVEIMLVAGFSGVGKTAVVNEVHKPIVRQRGYFIKGKYDQFGRNIPLSAFLQALGDLIGQLLSETDAQLEQWKTNILAALGEQAGVIVNVIPELEKIIGTQPSVPELSGSAAQNRFNLLFQKFLQFFTTKEHPLVMFLDDLQWADSASLNLMQLLMSEADTQYLLLIGAYRDNEVFPGHPLQLTLEEITKTGSIINTITLSPLKQSDLNNLIADTLNCSKEIAQPLTDIVYQKTKGNPFFSAQFFKALHEDGLINFNFEGGYWQCDIASVRALALTDDVVEFMALQLQKLPVATQEVLKLAACIGNFFDLNTLSIVHEKSQTETATDLWKALQEGLVIPTSEVYKFFQDEIAYSQELTISNEQAINYQFLHDRVQQAAYSLIPEDKKQATHLKIGQLLLRNTKSEREEKIFEIVNQLNIGIELITQQTQRDELAQLNLIAGRKAKTSTAYAAALEYLIMGIKLLATDSWHQYNLTLALHEEASEAAYLSGDFEQMEKFASVVLQQAKTLLDKVKVYEVKILAYIAQNKQLEAIKTALPILKLLGVNFPEKPNLLNILLGLANTKLALAKKDIEDLIKLPEMTAPNQLAAMDILSVLASAAFQAAPQLLPLTIFKQVNLSIKYGNTSLSVFAYASYAFTLCAIVGDIEAGYKFGKLALSLLELNVNSLKAKILMVVYSHVIHWKEHARKILKPLLNAYQSGLETGDLEYAAISAHIYCCHLYFTSAELGTVAQEMATYSNAIAQLNQKMPLDCNQINQQAVSNLIGKAENPCRLIGEIYDEEAMLPLHLQEKIKTTLFSLYLHKVILCYLFGSYPQAVESADENQKYLDGMIGSFLVPVFYLYDSLARLAIFDNALNSDKRILKKVKANQKKMQKWAEHAPMNYLHKFYLVEAERCRVLKKNLQAIEYYDKAIALAKENEYTQEEALSNELAAKFYLQWGKETIAQTYLTNAYYCYARWGAKAKVEDLEKSYPQLLAPILQQEKTRFNFTQTIATVGSSITLSNYYTDKTVTKTSTSVTEALDLASVIKASQALSGEIQLDNLLSILIQVVMENAGAKKGVLMLLKDDNLVIEASAKINQPPIILQSLGVNSGGEIPITLINYVKHTLETLVMDDATTQTDFASDSYIIKQQPKSLLCTPILHQRKLIGILYLENHLTAGVFTSDRLTVLNLLCSQAAISIENARLYQQSQDYAQKLELSLEDLKHIQLQLVQNEKMSALGNLVAGVAHEINNPLGFIAGNIEPASDYLQDLFNLINLYQQHYPNPGAEIEKEIKAIDLEYLREDLPKLISSMKLGIDRIFNISTSLRTFSRADTTAIDCNIHEGIDSTILILKHRLKPSESRPEIEVIKEYGNLPLVKCFPGQLNQVFMNLLANAIDALEQSNINRSFSEIKKNPNQITIKTYLSEEKNHVIIKIKDNGVGMPHEVKQKIFDHLFTTKAVGKGTGLGLAIARQIVVEKHEGTLEVNSLPGHGAEFIIMLPHQK